MNAEFQALCAWLSAAGVPDARFDAAELYRFVTRRDPRLDDGPTEAEAARLAALAERRAAREPLQYILGEWDFMDFSLKVGPGVLCPRADSEVVCETAIELLQGVPSPRVYDLCAGTGLPGAGHCPPCPRRGRDLRGKKPRRLALFDRQHGGQRRAYYAGRRLYLL